jgi:hypothetical protein
MLGSFLDRATQLLGNRYLITAWAPTFVVLATAAAVSVTTIGWSRSFDWWADLGGVGQATTGFLALLVIAAAAYTLESLPVIRVFEGYHLPPGFSHLGRWSERRRWKKLRDDAHQQWYRSMPRDEAHVLPTRLGNVFAGAETYPNSVYGMDGVFWWPRLVPHIPEEYRPNLDESLFPVTALLNAAFLWIVASVLELVWLVLIGADPGVIVAVYVGGMLLALFAYRSAISQAIAYGEWVRAAFDLYRSELWKELRLEEPKDLAEEWCRWRDLQNWLYNYDVPVKGDPCPDVTRPLVYAAPAPDDQDEDANDAGPDGEKKSEIGAGPADQTTQKKASS